MLKLINETDSIIVFADIQKSIAASSSFEISSDKEFLYQNSSDVILAITNGEISVERNSVSSSELSEQIDLLKGLKIEISAAKDSNGALISKPKFTKSGWVFKLESFDILSSKMGGSFYKDSQGNDKPYLTEKFYDSQGTELLNQTDVDTSCVRSVFDWELPFTFDILAGRCGSQPAPTEDFRSWVVVAPGIPKAQGGSVEFATGINFKHSENGWYYQDGRTPKTLNYVDGLDLTKFRMIFEHPVGFQHAISCIFEIFVSPENS